MDSVAVQDSSIKFDCKIESTPKAKISWFLNGKELTTKDNVKFEYDQKTSTYSLVIPKVLSSHSGIILVKASNSVGDVEHSFNIDVIGKFLKKFFYSLNFIIYFSRTSKIFRKIREYYCCTKRECQVYR